MYQQKVTDLREEYAGKVYPPVKTWDHIPGRLPWNATGEKVPYYNTHIGQRKLGLSEILFLSRYGSESKYVVYAGAAPSNKGLYLADLFPDHVFILVDPNPFQIVIDDQRTIFDGENHPDIEYVSKNDISADGVKGTHKRILIVNDFFDDDLSDRLSGLKPIFISDIRTQDESFSHPSDLDILWNSAMMYNWVHRLKTPAASLKFRPPYGDDRKWVEKHWEDHAAVFEQAREGGIDFIGNYFDNRFSYFAGPVNVQPWAPVSSSESRLYVTRKNGKYAAKDYDQARYDEAFSFYNRVARSDLLHAGKNTFSDQKFCFDKCNDCALEQEIWAEYLKHRGRKVTRKAIVKLASGMSKVSRGLCSPIHGKLNSYQEIKRIHDSARSKEFSEKMRRRKRGGDASYGAGAQMFYAVCIIVLVLVVFLISYLIKKVYVSHAQPLFNMSNLPPHRLPPVQ